MRIERFTGRDTRDAMAKVRADLGADAYILANRKVGGRVEVTAALEIEDAIRGASAVTMESANPANEIQLKALERELHQLRGILETELGDRSWRDVAGRKAPISAARQRLLRMGLSRTLVGSLLDSMSPSVTLEQAWRVAVGDLSRRLRTFDQAHARASIVALHGGTGVGKTSTIAKLAGRDVQRYGVKGVALITMDCYRIGAQEQLASFADALGLPLRPATDTHELSVALKEFRGRRIYIDTAGMSQHDPRLQDQYRMIGALRQQVEHLLVLAASGQASQGRAMAQAFGPGALSGAIITKVDEAQSLGGVLDVMLGAGLPLHSVASGQRIPEDIRAGDAREFVRDAVSLSATRRPGGSVGGRVDGVALSA